MYICAAHLLGRVDDHGEGGVEVEAQAALPVDAAGGRGGFRAAARAPGVGASRGSPAAAIAARLRGRGRAHRGACGRCASARAPRVGGGRGGGGRGGRGGGGAVSTRLMRLSPMESSARAAALRGSLLARSMLFRNRPLAAVSFSSNTSPICRRRRRHEQVR
jgi:hypothetical protein